MPRGVYEQVQSIIAYLILSIVGVGLVFGVTTILLLEKQVISRLSRLSENISSIGKSGNISARVSIQGTDELANVAGTINGMLAALQESESELRDREERYRLLAENVTDVILTMDMNLKFTYISPSIKHLTGYNVEETMAQTLADVLTPASLDVAMKTFAQELAIENMEQKDLFRSWTLELELRCKDGSTLWSEVKMTFLRDPDVKPIGIQGVARDITERRRIQQQMEQAAKEWRTTFDSISDLVSIIDKDFRLLRVNKAYADAVKMEPKELIGRNCYEVFERTKEPCLSCPHKDTIATKEPATKELFKPSPGIYLEISTSPVFNDKGEVVASICVARDITERKRGEEKLQELYNEERELRRELEAEMNKRVEFTRALVHELKTPLTPVLASSELLLEEPEKGTLLDLAKNINEGASNLNRRIDELFDLARGEIGMLQLNPEPVDPIQLLQGIVDSMAPVALRNGQSLNLELPSSLPTVWADEDRLRQVVLNLINNALKFTPAGGKIILRARQDGANLIIVEVQDTGRGISEEEQQRLFQPYHQLASDRARLGGLGLGLALSKRLVELHGGQMWVKSQKDKGSTFGFSVPLKAASRLKKDVKPGGKS